MSFVSIEYLFFIVPVLAVYWALRGRARNAFLMLVSYAFYGAWDPRFLLLIAFGSLLDFQMGRSIAASDSPARRRAFLLVSLAVNFGLLGFFKYFNFFADSFADLLALFGAEAPPRGLHIILPVGISFYTFQSVSYVIDVYSRRMDAVDSPVDYCAFVACFPQLVAGPIVRAIDFIPQVQNQRPFDLELFRHGTVLFLRGFVKKAFIADTLATSLVDPVFADYRAYGAPALLLATAAYSVQIYCDFSGYTDMARGSGAWMGFRFPLNFNYPYLATSPQDFWRRWHITLSTWFRDYVYIPLGGSRGGHTHRNLFVTFVTSGLWHGANWTFVLWGALHGLAQIVARFVPGLKGPGPAASVFRALGGWAATMLLVGTGWILFRSVDIGSAGGYLARILTLAPGRGADLGGMVALAFLLFAADHAYGLRPQRSYRVFLSLPSPVRGLLYALLTALLFIVVPAGDNTFIYFQF